MSVDFWWGLLAGVFGVVVWVVLLLALPAWVSSDDEADEHEDLGV